MRTQQQIKPVSQARSTKHQTQASLVVLVYLRPCLVLGFATGRSRYLVRFSPRQRVTRWRGRFAYTVENRTGLLSLIALSSRRLPIHDTADESW